MSQWLCNGMTAILVASPYPFSATPPTDGQVYTFIAANQDWEPRSVDGNFVAGGDLTAPSGSTQYVQSISGALGAGGAVDLANISFVWTAASTTAGLSQAQSTTGPGQAMTFESQAARTGHNENGGSMNFNLGAPDGSGLYGVWNFQQNGTSIATLEKLIVESQSYVALIAQQNLPIVISGVGGAVLNAGLGLNAVTGQPGAIAQLQAQAGDGATTKGGDVSLTAGSNGGAGTGNGGNIILTPGQGVVNGMVQIQNTIGSSSATGGSISPPNISGFFQVILGSTVVKLAYYAV